LLAAVAVLGLTAIPAATATKSHAHRNPPKCGTLYKPPCRKPTIVVQSRVACVKTGTILRFPITVRGNAGLRTVTVKLGSRTIRVVRFKNRPTRRSFVVAVNTRGSKPGIFTLTVRVTDVRGKSVTRRAHFLICKPKPPIFTG
jgi:hypothetical protein